MMKRFFGFSFGERFHFTSLHFTSLHFTPLYFTSRRSSEHRVWLGSFDRWVPKNMAFQGTTQTNSSFHVSRLLDDLGQQLSLVGALEQKQPGLRHVFELGLDNVLVRVPNRQLVLSDTLLQKLECLAELGGKVC
jgi:hypothetical protein